MSQTKKFLIAGVAVMVSLYLIAAFVAPAKAADLGGNCCADLEERIAELEATTARKGNTRVSVSVSGQINKAVLWWDDIYDVIPGDASVIENGASESYVSFSGQAQIRPGLFAGYTLEIGQGKTGLNVDLGTQSINFSTDNDIYTRQSYGYLKSETLGTVSLGLQSTATDDLTQQNVANTDALSKRLTLQPIGGVMITFANSTFVEFEVEPFNGRKANSVKYVSPTVAGFTVSAAWDSDTDAFDAALKFAGSGAGFEVVAAIGYLDRNEDGLFMEVDARTITLNAGIKHTDSGLFVQGSWGRIDVGDLNTGLLSGVDDFDAFHVQAGIERKWFANLGETTVFAEYADWGYDEIVGNQTAGSDLRFYGVGLNQSLIAAPNGESLVDLYVLYRHYNLDPANEEDEGVDTVLGGARVKF
jgi:hypothetical protein